MEYKRENFLRLRELVNGGQLDDIRLRKAQDYIRGYLTLNPQDAQSDLETVQRAQGKPTVTPEKAGSLDFETPQPSAAEQFGTGRQPSKPEYPPEYAANIEHEAALHPTTGGPTQREVEHEQLRQAAHQLDTETYDAFAKETDVTLPSASKAKGLYRPPEWVSPVRRITGENALSPTSTVYYSDPSIDEFRKVMQPMLGAGTAELTDNSPAFRAWQDAQYANAYDTAKANGFSIVRLNHARDVGWKDKAAGVVSAAVPGFLRSYTLGGSDVLRGAIGGKSAVAQSELSEASNPLASEVGGAVGMFSPGNLGVKAFGALGRGVSAAPGMAALESTGGGRLLGAGLRGGVGAIGVGGAEDASRAIAHAVSEGDVGELVPSAPDLLERSGKRALLGAGLGIAGEALGSGAATARERLRNPEVFGEVARDVKRLDKAGARLGLGGIKPSETMAPHIEAGRIENAAPEAIARGELEQPLVEEAGRRQNTIIRAAGLRKQAAIKAKEAAGNPKAVPWDAIDSVIALAKKGRDELGHPLPGVITKEETDFLRQAVKNVRTMPREAAEKYIRRHPESKLYEPADLNGAGYDMKFKPGDVGVVTATPVGVQKLADWHESLRKRIGAPGETDYLEKQALKAPDAAIRRLITERYPELDKALKISESDFENMRVRHAEAGLPEDIQLHPREVRTGRPVRKLGAAREDNPENFKPQTRTVISPRLRPAEEMPRFRSTLESPKSPETERQLRGLARSSGQEPLYNAMEALRARTRLQGKTDIHPTVVVGTSGPRVAGIGKWPAVRLRTDSMMKALAQLPAEQRSDLTGMARDVYRRLQNKFGTSLDDLDKLIQKKTLEVEYLSSEPGLNATIAEKAQREAAAAKAAPEAAENKTIPVEYKPRSGVVAEARSENAAKSNELLSELTKITREVAQRRAVLQPTVGTPAPPGSIRGGRIGRVGAIAGHTQTPELTPEELRVLLLIIDSQPEEKPKAAAAK
jgi:hypothetical protein